MSALVSIDALMKDLYPAAGSRIKQWVVDARREREWVVATCPRVHVPNHQDNCGSQCRNVGTTIWDDLAHDSCEFCNDLHEGTAVEVAPWQAERAKRPPGCSDRSVLSDEVQSDYPPLRLWWLA